MEIFARSFKKLPRTWLLSLAAVLALSIPAALAQDDYTPPPMFDVPDPLPPANANPPKDEPRQGIPIISKPVPEPKRSQPVIEKPAIKSSSAPAPLPSMKPGHSDLKKPQQQPAKKVKIDVPIPSKKPPVPQKVAQKIEKKIKREGVVKGPKTMPAVPAKDYETETLFKGEDGELEGAILKRHTEELVEPAKPEQPQIEVSEEDLAALNIFELQGGLARKIVIPFAQAQKELSDKAMASIRVKSAEILDANPDWRLQLMSYATPFDEGQSSDRRLSLNRALMVREALLAHDIEARKIDVRAMGNKAPDSPRDRIDLIFYAPDAEMDATTE